MRFKTYVCIYKNNNNNLYNKISQTKSRESNVSVRPSIYVHK